LNKKIKVLTLSDHPLSPSGVGTQTKYIIEALLKTGKFQFVSLGGAIKHESYKPGKVEGYEDDWVIFPVDGYGNPDVVRSIIRTERPDILWFMTDPRFWGWLWQMEDEIRPMMPMVYYHVWDNYPYPQYNFPFYKSNDLVVAISKVTYNILENVAPDVERIYLPHAVNTDVFKRRSDMEISKFTEESFAKMKNFNPGRKMFFWNNRNARRKQSGTLIFWFKEFLDLVGHENAGLLMHTDPKDKNGQDLRRIINDLKVNNGQVLLSEQKLPIEQLALIYNSAIATINISDAEGFGLSTLESLSCEVPIIVNMTGGLQEQVTDGKEWFGVGIEPAAKAVIGGQDIPYIYEDRLNKNDFIQACLKIYSMSDEERGEMGKRGRAHVMKNYNFDQYGERWIEIMTNIHEKHGSWENRKNHVNWTMETL
tara:strand:- start:3105 stop:4373 length:1269 start_codon:yes stop_codon:yes gene_type:complete